MASDRLTAEVLYLDGCPNHDALIARLRELMAQTGVQAPIVLKRVDSPQAAQRERFLGSPTLRINGVDVDASASQRTDYGLKCRLYATARGLHGTVPDELVRTALDQASHPRAGGTRA